MRYFLFLLIIVLSIGFSYGEVIVELSPSNVSVNVGESFNLILLVKNVPSSTKCGGFEATIDYDKSLLNLTNIQLSNTANTAGLKTVDVSGGKISLMWFSNNPYGNFTIATLTFKALSNGTTMVKLKEKDTPTSVSDENGIKYDINIINANISINSTGNNITKIPNAYFVVNVFEYNKSLTGTLILNNTITPIKEINGTISLNNVQLLGNIEPNISYKEFTIKKNIGKALYSGLAFYGENNYEKFYLDSGELKNLSLIAYNVKENITYISGCIYIYNTSNYTTLSLKFLGNKSIYKIKNEYVNNSWIGCYLYFNATPNKSGTFEIANIRIAFNKSDIKSSDIYKVSLINVSAYSGGKILDIGKSPAFSICGGTCKLDPEIDISLRSERSRISYTNISFGDAKVVYLISGNEISITNISGSIFINTSLLDVLDYNVSSDLLNNIAYKSILMNGSTLYFNLSFKQPIVNRKILYINITPKTNMDATTTMLLNITQNLSKSLLVVNIFKKDFSSLPPYYGGNLTNISFSIVPDGAYQNKTYLSVLNLPLKFYECGNIAMDIYQNGIKTNTSIILNKEISNITQTSQINNTIQIDVGSDSTEINMSYGQYASYLHLRLLNVNCSITNISGYVYVNTSLLGIENVSVYSHILNNISYKNISINGSSIYFNLSFKQPINGTTSLITFSVKSKVDKTVDTVIYLHNLTIYSNNTKVNLTVRNMTVHIIKRKTNVPPKLTVSYEILNNNEVHFHAFAYDEDGDTLSYFWDFGDGYNSTKKDPIHRYSNYTYYLVKCIVKDPLNGTDCAKFIVDIKNISPINYDINIGENKTKNRTLYLNISLKNPFSNPITAYINFINRKDYDVPEIQYDVTLSPNGTTNVSIPINISESTTNINWNVEYYGVYNRKFNDKVQFICYKWSFSNRVDITETKTNIKINNYTKIIYLNNSKVVLKINRNSVIKDYVINKTIKLDLIRKRDVIYYCLVSLIGFMVGLIVVRRIR
ncbi:PKD domain-containing protein [Methanotorris formicicus]|uniref:PKD domain-containing protein n=1 Tax=Methanotorris formicicus TaxID=213185 RepID=UPI000ACC7634